ncbi:MAG: nucleotidyltransferase domain-containing protein [Candidatus Omnitrophica bacterium]|nr:nucleotidyltransferase domain-containing protein [Candidatus Omnitrophota bacterium]
MVDKYLLMLKELVLDEFKRDAVKIVLFGSRARKDNSFRSDIDIGLIPAGDFDAIRISVLREKVEGLNIPYKIDIVNLNETSEDFRKQALKGALIWKD